jgi:hypothetical protein
MSAAYIICPGYHLWMEAQPPQEHDNAPNQWSDSLPAAGPDAAPQLVEIYAGPWRRVSVRLVPVRASRTMDGGSVWYWQPEVVVRLDGNA